jgi:hypothetical protein
VVGDRRRASLKHHFRERLLQRTAQQNEVRPAESYFPLEDGHIGESCSGGIQIAGEQTVWCLLRRYSKINKAPQETCFLLQQYSIHAGARCIYKTYTHEEYTHEAYTHEAYTHKTYTHKTYTHALYTITNRILYKTYTHKTYTYAPGFSSFNMCLNFSSF